MTHSLIRVFSLRTSRSDANKQGSRCANVILKAAANLCLLQRQARFSPCISPPFKIDQILVA
jgi:hypothetical protein